MVGFPVCGGAVEQRGAEVGFKAVKLFDEGGPVDADGVGGFGDAAAGHGGGEAFDPGPAGGLAVDGAK